MKFLFFWGHTPHRDGELGRECLSQWWERPFELDGRVHPTAEHAMMTGKALLFGDEHTAGRIAEARTPGEAKSLGRQVRGFDEDTWVRERLELVARLNEAKFGQHDDLRAYLLGTGERVLVEASPVDRIWGIGLAADDPRAGDPQRWRGLNLLGEALMLARARLASGQAQGWGTSR
ncbi:NADAR family protein [Actinosynnema pretiosum]|nr:NADAR family protein [Actinosynnema pretiosum]